MDTPFYIFITNKFYIYTSNTGIIYEFPPIFIYILDTNVDVIILENEPGFIFIEEIVNSFVVIEFPSSVVKLIFSAVIVDAIMVE